MAAPTAYADQRTFRLADYADLPGDAEEEADIEGLARDGAYLWAVGSHSRKRKRVRADHDDVEGAGRLATVVDEPNRHVLLRLPVVDDGGGPVPVRRR